MSNDEQSGSIVAREDITFFSEGTRIAGDLFTPPEGVASAPAMVVCHGFGGIKEFYMGDISRLLASHGHTVLTFDYRGFGQSDGPRNRLFPLEQVQDAIAAVDYLSTRVEIHSGGAGIYGTSFGGGIALAAAAASELYGAAVSAVGIADCYRWLRALRAYWQWTEFEERVRLDRIQSVVTGASEVVDPDEIMVRDPESIDNERKLRSLYPNRAFKLDLASARAIMAFRPIDYVRTKPVARYIIGVEEDTLTPFYESQDVYNASVGPKDLLKLRGITHHEMYEPQHLAGVLESVSSFVTEQIGAVA